MKGMIIRVAGPPSIHTPKVVIRHFNFIIPKVGIAETHFLEKQQPVSYPLNHHSVPNSLFCIAKCWTAGGGFLASWGSYNGHLEDISYQTAAAYLKIELTTALFYRSRKAMTCGQYHDEVKCSISNLY